MTSSSSELAFKNLSESIRTSLQTFNALHAIPSSGVVSSPLCLTLNELINAAVCNPFNSLWETDHWLFVSSGRFSSLPGLFWTPFFQELALAAHIAIDKFFKEFKDFKGPTQAFLLAGLAAHAKDARTLPAKQSNYPSLTFCTFHKALCLANADATASPTGPYSEKIKEQRAQCVSQINSASCTSIDSKLLRSNALIFLKKRSKTLMRKACCLFKSLSPLTLKACPLYHLRISHLVILLIMLWVFIFPVWPHDLDSLPSFFRNQLVLISLPIL